MTRGPSVERLMNNFNLNKSSANMIKNRMSMGYIKASLELFNNFVDGYGVEILYPEYPDFQYVNMGDTYKQTLCYTGKSFIVSSWGDYVEKHKPVSNDGSNPN
jgi:hypothetical protein